MDNQELMKKLEKTESVSQAKLRSELPDIDQTEWSTESKQDSNPGPGNELKALSELTKQLHQKNATISALQLSVERCNMVRDRPSLNIKSPGLNIQPQATREYSTCRCSTLSIVVEHTPHEPEVLVLKPVRSFLFPFYHLLGACYKIPQKADLSIVLQKEF